MREIVIAHSSDLHLCGGSDPGDLRALEDVLRVAGRVKADVVLLAGDVFDHNRAPLAIIDSVGRLLGEAVRRVVILPGNHDCLVSDSVYRRGSLAYLANVDVLGVSVDESVLMPEYDLEVWGRPHLDYVDMVPLQMERPRSTRWQIAMAHGHWVTGKHDLHRSYLIRDEEIAACTADYIALGHWDRALQIGDGTVAAYYSGSPQLAKTVNVIRLRAGGVNVTREPLEALKSPG